jgi:hypothetical protein
LSTSETIEYLMFPEEKMKKAKQLLPGNLKMVQTKSGRLSISIKPKRNQPVDLMRTSATWLIDHSISDQEWCSTEFLTIIETTGYIWEDMLRTEHHSNGSSTELLTPSRANGDPTNHSKSGAMEATSLSALLQPMLDGGNFGDTKMASLSTREERS